MAIKKSVQLALVIFIVFFVNEISSNSNSRHQGCTIKLPADIPSTEPLYLSGNPGRYRLFKPINEINPIAVNSILTLYCAGRANTLTNTKTNRTELTCVNGNRFLSENGTEFEIRRTNCTKGIESAVDMTREKCSNNRGYIFDIGFRLDRRNFITVFKVCYDNSTETTFFSTHHINGPVVKHFVKNSKRRNFKTTGISANTHVNMVYNKQQQINRFNELLGSQQNFINSSIFLSRGHLTPDADFIFPNFQLSTYFYVNVAPQYQTINGGNWVRIENMARNLASDYNTEFVIYTGIHEVLYLPNRNRKPIALFLDSRNKIEVPKWFWKVIKNIKLDAAIVMITLNNPFAKRNEVLHFCPNVCKQASLTSQHFENFKRGYTFCCEIEQFKRVVHDLPANFSASRLLGCAQANHIFKY